VLRGLTILLLVAIAMGAQPSFSVVAGKAVSIAGDQIVVQSGPGSSLLLFADKESQFWRGKMTHTLSVVQPGDDVILRYRKDSTGRSVIIDLHANIGHIWGRISKLGTGEFEVDENYNADPHSAYRRGFRQIAFDSETEFEESAPEDLRIGRDVDIIGLKTNDTRVQASRITVYEGHAPVRMPAGARVILPDGTVQTRK
jgi:hypothetical protein